MWDIGGQKPDDEIASPGPDSKLRIVTGDHATNSSARNDRATGDVKLKLSTTCERCVLVEAWLPTAISTTALLRTRPTPTSKMR